MRDGLVLRGRSAPSGSFADGAIRVGRGIGIGLVGWLAVGGGVLAVSPRGAEGKPAATGARRAVGKPAAPASAAANAATSTPASTATPAATATTGSRPTELDAETRDELRTCPSPLVPGQAIAADSRSRPALVVGRRRVYDRVRGYVCIPAYSISPKPVTQSQYESVIGVRPHGKDFVADRPVFVSFVQAAHYCNAASLRDKLTPCYEVRIDKKGKETIAWPSRQACTGYRLPAAEEAAAYERGTESEWTWVSDRLPIDQLDVRTDAPRGFYLARNTTADPAAIGANRRHAKR